MRFRLLLLYVAAIVVPAAQASTLDLGAQIIEADARLGASAGQISVSTSGIISEGRVSLSAGHALICGDGVVIYLAAGSFLYQNSNTLIKNCTISATSVPIQGEIQSENTSYLELDHVNFIGGGNQVYWLGVTHFSILSNTIASITAVDDAGVRNGFYLLNCSRGRVDNLRVANFVYPAGINDQSDTAVLGIYLSSYIRVDNPVIQNVDASYINGGSGAILIAGSNHILVSGGTVTGNPNMDGVLSEAFGRTTPSNDVAIINVDSSNNGGIGLNPSAHDLGCGLDIINTQHLYVSHATLDGNGNVHDQQPAIWIFLDDDVFIANSDLSDSARAGIATAGSTNVRLVHDTINRNQASGVFTEWQAGTATNVGPAVTWVSGLSGGFSVAWEVGTPFILDGVAYPIASVPDFGHVMLSSTPPDHSSPVSWGVNSTQYIVDTVIDDNGIAQLGGTDQQGIFWSDGTTGAISGVTSTNTGIGAQQWGLQLANTASAILLNDNFTGNLMGGDGIDAGPQTISTRSLSFSAQEISTQSPSQKVRLYAGAVVLAQLAIQTSGDFSQTNACGTQVAAFAYCDIQVTFKPTTAGTRNGTLTISNSAPQSPQIVSMAGTGILAGLGLGVAAGGSDSNTVVPGKTAAYKLSIGGDGIAGDVLLGCTGAPSGATCSLPSNESISASTVSTFTVSVATTASSSSALQLRSRTFLTWAVFLAGWVIVPLAGTKNRPVRRSLWMALLLVVFCSCGGSGSLPSSAKNPTGPSSPSSPGTPSGPGNPSGPGGTSTPAGTYTITVTAKIGTTSQSLPLKLTVQ